jgi:hypothetical protein
MSAKVIQVIDTVLELRGTGVIGDPYRRVRQFYSLDGVLLMEKDDYSPERRALQSIADSSCCEGCQEAARVARAALVQKESR